MRRPRAAVEGSADLVAVRVERAALAVDALVTLADGEPWPAHPMTMWVVRPSDERLAWITEKNLNEWASSGELLEMELDVAPDQPRVQLASDEVCITFELLACAGLPTTS